MRKKILVVLILLFYTATVLAKSPANVIQKEEVRGKEAPPISESCSEAPDEKRKILDFSRKSLVY